MLKGAQPEEAVLLEQVTAAVFDQHREQTQALKPVYGCTQAETVLLTLPVCFFKVKASAF